PVSWVGNRRKNRVCRARPDLDAWTDRRPRDRISKWRSGSNGRGERMQYQGQEYYEIDVAGLRRRLPIVPINDSLWIAAFVLWGDVGLTNACAPALPARLRPLDFDYLLSLPANALPPP